MYFDKIHVDVLIFLEHKDRELEVVLEIARKLKKDYALSVAIASTVFDRLVSLWLVRPRVVLFHSNKSLPPIFHTVYGDRIGYACLNWEQMLSTINKKIAKKPDDCLNKDLMKNFVWGRNYRDFLVDLGIPDENVIITGRPSLTLLKKKAAHETEIRQVIADKHNLDYRLKWLFFPLTCLHAFFNDDLVRQFARNNVISNEVDEELAFARRNYARRTVHEIFRWIDALGNSGAGDFIVILRPHPMVAVDQHRELFEKLFGYVPDYVYITKSYSAQEWLISSDICYTNYSSVALDAYFIKKPAYLLEPEPYPKFLEYEWFQGFRRLKTIDELNATLQGMNDWVYRKNEVIEAQFDTGLDGIQETAALLSKFVKETKNRSKPNYLRLIKAVYKEPRKYFNWRSQAKSLFMQLNIRKRSVPRGRQSDFFKYSEIKTKLGHSPDFNPVE